VAEAVVVEAQSLLVDSLEGPAQPPSQVAVAVVPVPVGSLAVAVLAGLADALAAVAPHAVANLVSSP